MTDSSWARRRLRAALLIIGILFLVGAAGWGPISLPENWNVRNLRQVEAISTSPLIFALVGDSRNGQGVFVRVLKQMAADRDLAFAIHLGDMVPAGEAADFRLFFRQLQAYLPIPLLGVAGNHDLKNGGSRLWERVFGPRDYAFQVQGHCFLVLDDNPPSPDEAQWRWLTRELANARSCKSRLVFMHQPLFDPRHGPRPHALPPEEGRKLAVLFQQHRVTHIFAGHIHGYFTGEWSGVPYTITGGGGVKLVGTDPAHYFYHYVKVVVTDMGVRVKPQPLASALHGN